MDVAAGDFDDAERTTMTTATKSVQEILIGQWHELGKKVLALGEALPASAFEERPLDGVRTPGEIFRHLAFWHDWVAASAKGERPDGSANELPKSAAPSKAEALAAFERSSDAAAKALAAGGGEMAAERVELASSFLGHTAEHYGQLAVYARLNGVVPPASR
jgi:uncharacterized damage-inducible protein DinB